jgi:hypothetical protein
MNISELNLNSPIIPAISQKCGIYFLLRAGEIVYVGQSKRIEFRVETHRMEKKKDFDSYAFVECKPEELDQLEQDFIIKCDTEYNAQMPKGNYASTNWIKENLVGRYVDGGFGPSKIAKTMRANGANSVRMKFFGEMWLMRDVQRIFNPDMLKTIKRIPSDLYQTQPPQPPKANFRTNPLASR